jgi:hypothetical protein
MGTLRSKKRELLLSPLISGTSLASRIVAACLLGSLLVALPSTINVAIAASPTITQLTIPSGLNNGVNDISVSDDGTKLVFVTGALNGSPYGGGVYQSLNSGATWTSTSSLPTDRDSVPSYVASTNTGQNVLIAPYSSSVLYRSADYGATWTPKSLVSMRAQCGGNNLAFVNVSPSGEASGMDMSADGTVIAMSKPFSSCLLISRDSGANFSYINLPVSMGAVGAVYVSSSGNAIWYAKSETGGGLWKYNLTTNSWGSNLSSTVGLPRSITGSQNGTIIYAAGGDMQNSVNFSIYKSTNSGETFTALNNTSKNWLGLKASSDGTKLIGWDRSNNVYISQDSGVTWDYQNNPSSGIQSVKFSGDGSKAYMTTGNQYGSTPVTKVFQYAFPVASTTTIASQLQSVIYGATDTLTATIVVGGAIATNATGTVSFYDNSTLISECSNITVSAGIATCPSTSLSAGEHTNITASYSGGGSISASISGASSTVSVAKAALSVIPTSISVAYGGTPSYLKTYTGFKNGQSSSSSSFVTGLTAPTCVATSYTTSTSVSASPLSITCSGGSSTNYTFTYLSTADLTITKATPTLSIALNASTPTYGTVDTITATASLPGVVDFKIGGATISGCGAVSTETSVPYTANCSWIPSAASTSFALTASLTPTNSVDYSTVTSSTTTTINSNRAAITVTPTPGQSKVYGANNPTITYSITSGSLIGSDTLSGALTYTGSNAGSYAIGIGTLANSNYIITLASVNFSITQATQSAVSLSSLSSGYNPSNKTVALTGTGGTGTGSYLTTLDASNTTPGCSVTGTTLTYTTAGTCVIAVTRSSDINYLARTDVVSFSIGLASQTITFNSLSAKSYSSDTFTVSASSSASLTVVFTSGSNSVCTTSGTSGSTITLLGVGTCVINANQLGDTNTGAAGQVSQNFTVNPRAITVTADAKTKVYGASDPTFTYSITTGSLVLGDALTGALTRAAGTDVGTYQIQQGALTTSNNLKYAITFVGADLSITRATPTLVLTYPNSNVAILRPSATDTPTVTTSLSAGSLTYATSAASSICTVNSTSGVISLFGAGSCPIAMTTAQTANYLQHTETTTVTVALLSTSLTGINQSNLVSMGQPFYAHATIDQSYSFSSGSNGASVSIPAGALDASVPISIHLLADSTDQRALITSDGTSVLSVVVSWVASDGSVPSTNTGKAISVTLTNPAIKNGAKVYSIIGNQSQLLGTATTDGSITTLITEDPVLLVINPVVTTPAPSSSSSGGGGGGGYVMAVVVDNSAATEAANLKLAADKAAAELKAAQEKAAAAAAEAAAVKAARDLADSQAQAAAELKASQEKAAEELRIAEELRLAQLKAEADLKLAAEKKAISDFATASRNAKAAVTLYSVSPTLKLNSYDSAYLAKYVKSLKNGALVTCIGYTYEKSPASKASQALAKRQATAVCAQMKKTNKTLKTSIVIYPASKAPKAAVGAKWVGVSYRIDGFKAQP